MTHKLQSFPEDEILGNDWLIDSSFYQDKKARFAEKFVIMEGFFFTEILVTKNICFNTKTEWSCQVFSVLFLFKGHTEVLHRLASNNADIDCMDKKVNMLGKIIEEVLSH